MDKPPKKNGQPIFSRQIGVKVFHKLKAQRRTSESIWAGFSLFGIIGWSVAVPTLLGIALGIWIDRYESGKYSWTLMLMAFGLLLGCLNASHWIVKEYKNMHEDSEDKNG